MTRIFNNIKFDIASQIRNGIYFVYLIISIIYAILIRMAPLPKREIISIIVLFSDPSMLGFFFIGGIVLLEKLNKTLENIFVTPLRVSEYIISKIVSLSLVSIASSIFIEVFSHGLSFKFMYLFLGILLSSILFTLLGLILAVKVNTLNEYIWISPFYVIILFIPLLEYFGIYKTPLFYLIPGKAALIIIEAAFRHVELWQLVYAFIVLSLSIILAYIWAYKSFYKHIILRIGGVNR